MLSIVIPTYNEEKYLPKLLKSIKNQTYKDYEIIVADNFSKDKTRQLAKNCKLVDGGFITDGNNKGARIAKYDILFLHADVILKDKTFLTKFLKSIKEENLDIATCYVLPDTRIFSHVLYYHAKNILNKFHGYFSPHINAQGIFIKKKLFEKINGFDETVIFAEEHDLVNRARKAGGKFKFLLQPSIYTSTRRIKKEGFLKLSFISLYLEIYAIFFGKIKKKIFDYEFGNYD